MKHYLRCIGVFPERGHEEVYRDLCRIYPEGKDPTTGWFECRLPLGDPVARRIAEALRGYRVHYYYTGREPHTDVRPVGCAIEREYDEQDWDAACLLEIAPRYAFPMLYEWDPELRVGIKSALIPTGCDIGTYVGFTFVSSRLKEAIEREGMSGVRFTLMPEAEVEGDEDVGADLATEASRDVLLPDVDSGGGAPFWEMTGDASLPTLSPRCVLMDSRGYPFDGDHDKSSMFFAEFVQWVVEFKTTPPELHYLERDLAGLPPFGVAVTHERFGSDPYPWARWVVVSNRFYQWVKAHRIPCDWVPVRIDTE